MYKIIDDKDRIYSDNNFFVIKPFGFQKNNSAIASIKKYLFYILGVVFTILFTLNNARASIMSTTISYWGNLAHNLMSSASADVSAAVAAAQSAGANITGLTALQNFAGSSTFSNMVNEISSLTGNFVNLGIHEGVNFVTVGATPLLMMLFAVLLAWKAIKSTLAGSGGLSDLMKEIIELSMTTSIFALMLYNYSSFINLFISSFNFIAGSFVTGGTGSTASSTPLEAGQVSGIVSFFVGLYALFVRAIGNGLLQIAKAPWDIGNDTMIILEVIFLAVVGWKAVQAITVYIMQFFFSVVMLGIGAAMGPVMIPFGIWDKTYFLFDGWLKFIITMGLYRVVGALIFTLMHMISIQLYPQISTNLLTQSGIISISAMITLYVFIVLLTELIRQMPSIAAEIVTGFPKTINAGTVSMAPMKW
jgi:hypothetical protein